MNRMGRSTCRKNSLYPARDETHQDIDPPLEAVLFTILEISVAVTDFSR